MASVLLFFLFVSTTAGFSPPPRMPFGLRRHHPYSTTTSRRRRHPWRRLVLHPCAAAVVKESEEPLRLLFQRAVVWQRAGEYDKARQEYNLILKAAQQAQLPVEQYVEVHVNLGALYMRQGGKNKHDDEQQRQQARYHFTTALSHRESGVAHVNLAVLILQDLTQHGVHDKQQGQDMLQQAQTHCQKALELQDDKSAQVMATRLLGDIDKMLGQL